MNDKITNFQEYENFLNQKLIKNKTNFPYDIVEFINLEKNQELDKIKFLELLPQINYNNIQFYENRIKKLEENKIPNLKTHKKAWNDIENKLQKKKNNSKTIYYLYKKIKIPKYLKII